MGRPGWPEFDLLMASTARNRMLLMQSDSSCGVVDVGEEGAATIGEGAKG